jgi:hypothetical protein
MVGMTALEVLNITPIVLLASSLHWRISANQPKAFVPTEYYRVIFATKIYAK